ncbi:MAG: PKD domain-containing protein, partial [Phycisphaerae bacterium]
MLIAAWQAQSQTPSAPTQDLYCFVIDKSESIKTGNLINPIRGAGVDFVGRLPEQTVVQLVFFNASATRPRTWPSMDFTAKGEFAQYFIEKFAPSDGTALYDTVADVFQRVAAELGRYRQIHVIILSDGKDEHSTTYKSWAQLERLMVQLKLKQKNTLFSWYSLGPEVIKDVPESGMIDYRRFPDVSRLSFFVPAPLPEFSGSPQKVKAGEPVLFVLENEATATNALWSFGDGATSRNFKPRHAYDREGAYDVQVVVAGPGGSATNLQSRYIAVLRDPPLEAHFKWRPSIGRVGEALQLFDESTGGAEAWVWRVDGGAPASQHSLEITPSSSGRTVVALEVRRGEKSASTTNFIDVLPQPPGAAFALPRSEVQVGEEILLRPDNADPSWQHEWLIGTETNLSGPEVRWRASHSGRFDVLHRVRGAGGLTEKESVLVVADALMAEFSWAPAEVRVGEELRLHDESVGTPRSWTWTVGAVGAFSNRFVNLKPATAGALPVTLKIERAGRTATTNHMLVVLGPPPVKPDAAFLAAPKLFRRGEVVTFSALQNAPGWRHEWTVAGEAGISGVKATWTADRLGQVTVEHTVVAPNGTDRKTETILGRMDLPVAEFSATPVSGKSPFTVHFRPVSAATNLIAFRWEFGDGAVATERSPSHTYRNDGRATVTFTPSLAVTNDLGERAAERGKVLIAVAPPPPWWRWPLVAAIALMGAT